MLDFFVIFSKGGIVFFATVNKGFEGAVNKLIKSVILEERKDKFTCDSLTLQYQLDNEFELVFVVAYQKMLSLSYIDKFLSTIQLAFRDKFKDFDHRSYVKKLLGSHSPYMTAENNVPYYDLIGFYDEYSKVYTMATKAPNPGKQMRSFDQSAKSQKTVGSMVMKPGEKGKENAQSAAVEKKKETASTCELKPIDLPARMLSNNIAPRKLAKDVTISPKGSPKAKLTNGKGKKEKVNRLWDLSGKDDSNLDFSKKDANLQSSSSLSKNIASASGVSITDYQIETTEMEVEYSDEEEDNYESAKPAASSGFFGSIVNRLSFNKALTKEDLDPILNQLRDHLISKNVAAEVSNNLIDAVSAKLEGKSENTWIGLKATVRRALEDSVLSILTPSRNINILKQVKDKPNPPYSIVFCGVNGVGKSTNLAKIANWLILSGIKVLVIACDTFRAGAIEQLRTHVTALKNIHETDGKAKIDLFAKDYGKDPAGTAFDGINFAKSNGYNCCLIDTAGRMQDNRPLMDELAKLIKNNKPDLTLFVGEALVGNEAVDQLTKFNSALLDRLCTPGSANITSAINGIVLTKFDTIDDQVGAAVSMTYITGQPIVFVGVGQTYRDLKQLNAKAVVKALMN